MQTGSDPAVTHSEDPDVELPLHPTTPLPVELDSELLDTPAVLIDLDVVEQNISSMADLARRRGLALRPHVKTHKSTRFADAQLAAGAVGVCVATVGEAEVMWRHGVEDILLAYPVIGKRKLQRLRPLLDAEVLTLVADSVEVAEGYSRLAQSMSRQLPVLLEIDSGMNRAGASPSAAGTVGSTVAAMPGLELRGILTHAGHAHDAPTQLDIERVARDEVRAMQQARESLEAVGVEVSIVSAGSSITTRYLSGADGITEARPGTYLFNDLRTLGRFACTADQIAATMLATVVSRSAGRATINAGSKSLTSSKSDSYGYGHLLNRPRSEFSRLSEEHGVITLAAEDDDLRIGDRVRVLPIHICVWMDLQPWVYGVRGGQIVERIRVGAMRHSL